ncbi:MAG: hypothetical protein WC342_08590 [Methanoregula sp.]|jgi:hypothetical protein
MTKKHAGPGGPVKFQSIRVSAGIRYGGLLLVLLMLCIGISAGIPGYTASFSPASGTISPDTQITITVDNIQKNHAFNLSLAGTGLHLTTASYSLNGIYMPFNLSGSSVYAADSNSDALSVLEKDPDGFIKSYGPSYPASIGTIKSGTYEYITLSGPSALSGQTINTNLWIKGTVSDANPPASSDLQYTVGGADLGTLTFEVSDGSSTIATVTYTIVSPAPTSTPSGPDSGDGPVAPFQLGPTQQPTAQQTQTGPAQALVTVQTPVTGTGTITSGPITASPEGMPNIQVSWTTTITSTPESGASIQTSILQTLDPTLLDQYKSYLADLKETYAGLAYAIVIEKSGIAGTGPATVTMTVPSDWLNSVGGINSIVVIHTADDGGIEFLTPTITSIDPSTGYVTLTVTSPNGLSTFGLVTEQPGELMAPSMTTPGAAAPTTTTGVSNTTPGAKTTKTPLPTGLAIISVGLIIAVIGAYRKY